MTTIIINEKYKIDVDQYNYSLIEIVPYQNKKGEDTDREKICGYYPALQNALVALSHLMTIGEREEYSIAEYINQSIESSKTVRNSLKLKIKDLEEE